LPAIEATTRRSRTLPLLCLLVVATAACGSWKRVGVVDPETPPERLPEIFDPTNTYREMGLLADRGPLGFVGTARILAGSQPDSLLLVIALSMRSRGFSFKREGDQFVAQYRVQSVLRTTTRQVAVAQREETVRVGSFRETQRSDESLIFQQFLSAPPGDYLLSVSVRDRNSTNEGRVEVSITVPELARTAISLPIAVYSVTPRRSLERPPELVINPRSSIQFGTDSLRFYIETYGLAPGSAITLAAVDGAGRTAWTDSVRVDSEAVVHGFVVLVPPAPLSIGRYDLQLSQGGTLTASTPFLVAFSDQFAVGKLQDIVSLLRYFAPPDTLRALLNAPESERAAAWQHFFQSTDPNHATPENEAIDAYLHRVQIANERFRDEGVAGWLTERGEVFITLGEPSEMFDRRHDMQSNGGTIVWTYYEHRLTLYFYDDGGFGRYRLAPGSRAEYQRIVNRLREQ
jgi:GWxTD domain-containing protein